MNNMQSTIPRPQTKTVEAKAVEFDMDQLPPGIRAALEKTAEMQKTYSAARFAPKDTGDLRTLAEEWYDSDLLPEAYYPEWTDKKTGKPIQYSSEGLRYWRKRGISRAVIVMRYGAALGVLPEMAIRLIYIIDGQPSPAAALMLAIFLASPVCAVFEPLESSSTSAKMRVGRKGQKAFEVAATYAEYKHLHERKNWKNYPTDLVYARCLARAMRRVAPDLFAGVYCAEERVDFRADKAAGATDDVLDRILSSVDTEARAPFPTVTENEQAPVSAAETPQEPPAKPPFDRAVGVALLNEIRTVSEAIEPAQIEALRARVKGFEGTPAYEPLIAAWNASGILNPAQVAS